jgi:predicted TIM-barrel fold metal-dependent hydrolase
VYGSDNSVLLHALAHHAGRHRGVVVLAGHETPSTLEQMHALGVRGVRFNCVSPVGEAQGVAGAAAKLQTWLPRLEALRWHVQWYLHPAQLAEVAALQNPAVPFVLDHLAGMHADLAEDAAAWQHLTALSRGGAWVKLSGWYRLRAQAPYSALHANIQRVAALFGPRCVWGSDWPHTGLAAQEVPRYAQLLKPCALAVPPWATAATAAALYQ